MATFLATGSVLGLPLPGGPTMGSDDPQPATMVAPADVAQVPTVTEPSPDATPALTGVPGRWIGVVVSDAGAGAGAGSGQEQPQARPRDAVSPSASPSVSPSPTPSPTSSPTPSPRPSRSPKPPPPQPTPSPEPEPEPTRSPDPGDDGGVICDFDWRAGPAEVERLIRCAAQRWEVPGGPDKAVDVAMCESSLRPDAIGGDGLYLGIFQQHRDYWPARATRYGFDGVSALNGRANIIVSIRMASEGGWGPWTGCA